MKFEIKIRERQPFRRCATCGKKIRRYEFNTWCPKCEKLAIRDGKLLIYESPDQVPQLKMTNALLLRTHGPRILRFDIGRVLEFAVTFPAVLTYWFLNRIYLLYEIDQRKFKICEFHCLWFHRFEMNMTFAGY